MDEERDFVVFTDEDGNEFELDVITYFDYKDNEYAILADLNAECDCEDENCEEDNGLYIMRIIVNEEENTEEFVPPEDDEMEELIAYAEEILAQDECDCEDCCDCGEHHCDCGCEDK